MSVFHRTRDWGWTREEQGRRLDGAPAFCHVTDSNDESPIHHTYPTGYDSRCGWCWLGYTHSEFEHGRRVGNGYGEKVAAS